MSAWVWGSSKRNFHPVVKSSVSTGCVHTIRLLPTVGTVVVVCVIEVDWVVASVIVVLGGSDAVVASAGLTEAPEATSEAARQPSAPRAISDAMTATFVRTATQESQQGTCLASSEDAVSAESSKPKRAGQTAADQA